VADFTTLNHEVNTGTLGSPTWTVVSGGSNKEIRFSDVSSAGLATASASWPFMTRPAATGGVDYAYAFTADTTGLGIIDAGSNVPTAFSNANYLFGRWNWDALGTFASAPIFTAYPTTGHGSVSRGDGSVLGGHATDTGATARSYLKGNAFGRVDSAGAPAAAPANAPTVTDGATGAVTPSAGANWATNYQGLQGDNDWLAFPSTPAATTADKWSHIFRLFTGPNMSPGTLVPVMSLKYTYT
jgi:hypothetical protein